MMTLDPKLLKNCVAKAEHLIQLEQDAEHAKIEYHTEIRRLHLKGGSYREIASALGLSHQRISQIVKGVSPSWINRLITKNDTVPKRPLCCSLCGQSQHEVKKLVAGPSVYICNRCIDISRALFNGASTDDIPNFTNVVNEHKYLSVQTNKHCQFCGDKQKGKNKLIGTNHDDRSVGICQGCLSVAEEHLAQNLK